MDSLRIKVVQRGDVCSYNELRDSFMVSEFPDEVLFYAIVMAIQFGYSPANEDVCQHFKSFYGHPNMKPMDSFTDSIYHHFLEASEGEAIQTP